MEQFRIITVEVSDLFHFVILKSKYVRKFLQIKYSIFTILLTNKI